MPIREENKARYPDDWKHISRSIREAAGNVCQACGVDARVGLGYKTGAAPV